MKIAFINDGAFAYASAEPSATGGAERDQWLLGAALAAQGWSVVVGVRNGLKPRERRRIKDVEFIGIDRGQIFLTWYRFLSLERPRWWYWECADYLFGPAVEIAKLLGIQTIFALGLDRDVEPRRALSRRKRLWPLYAWGLSRTNRIFVQHEGQLCRLPSQWRSKAYIFPKVCLLPGIVGDTITVQPHSDRAQYVAWVAMLRHPKRPDMLIDIARKAPDVNFVVCGGPSNFLTPSGYSERMAEQLRSLRNVEFQGQVAPAKAERVIADAAILLCTSDEEGFPNTFTQAWSSGTPVISLKLDPGGLIEQRGLGVLSGSTEQAIADIRILLNSPQRREDIAIRARRFVAENYSATAVVKLFERIVYDDGLSDMKNCTSLVISDDRR